MQGGKRIGIYPAGGVNWFDRVAGTWRAVYQLTPQLTDSAAEYAYMSLGLSPSAVLGRGTYAGAHRPGAFGPPPLTAMQAPKVAGLPTLAGQFAMQPLGPNEVR